MGSTSVKVALIQQAPVYLNLVESTERACRLVAEAAEQGATVIAFPETWLPGYPVWLDLAPAAGLWEHPPAKALYRHLWENSPALGDETCQRLAAAATEAEALVVMGCHERYRGTLYNSILYFMPGQTEPVLHRKLVPTYTERLIWGRGDGSTLAVVDMPFGKVGGLICWEHWMPLARAAMHARGEAIHVAQWPEVVDMQQVVSRSYAFEGRCFVLAAGCRLSKGQVLTGFDTLKKGDPGARALLASMPGDDDTLMRAGGSAVIRPDGSYSTDPEYNGDATILADLNLDLITEGRLTLDTDGHYARPDVFQLQVDETPQTSVHFSADPTHKPCQPRSGQE